MNKPLLFALVFTAALTAFAANPAQDSAPNAASIAGKWKIHTEVADNEYDGECTLTQADSVVGGTCTTVDGTNAKVAGKVDGATVNWSYDSEYNGTPMTLTYKGTLNTKTGEISGTVDVDPFNAEGDFTAVVEK